MKKILILSLYSFLSFSLFAQDENPLAFFEPLMGKTWTIEAEWGDGSVFKQELRMHYALNKAIIQVETKGYINPERTEFGDRNYGIRKFDKESGKVLFWEFDAFGGVTTGEVVSNGKDLWFIYSYGETQIADIWKYLDNDTYEFRVVQYNNSEIGDTYLIGEYKTKN